MKPWIIIAVVALAGTAWMARWSTPVALNGESSVTIDRITGQAWLLDGEQRLPIMPAIAQKAEPAFWSQDKPVK